MVDLALKGDFNFLEYIDPTGDPSFAIPEKPERASRDTFTPSMAKLEGYTPPDKYHSIAGLPRIGLDIEGYDPNLKEKGPGERRRHDENGGVCGIGIGPRSNIQYYPIRTDEDYFKSRLITFKDRFIRELRKEAREFDGEIVGANLLYDLTWLMVEYDIIFPKAKLRDIQIAEPLIDENKFSYKLEVLSKEYTGVGKTTSELEKAYGPGFIKNMHRVDPGFSSIYCIDDIAKSMDVFALQEAELYEQDLTDIFLLESDLMPVLLEFRKNGVRIDKNKVKEAVAEIRAKQKEAQETLNNLSGIGTVDVWSNEVIAKAFDKQGEPYLRTSRGAPSFRKDWLAKCKAPIAKQIMEVRRFDKISGTFLESYLLEDVIGDRIFGQFHQLRSDANGTVSGRFSSSNPNLQNIPVRDPWLGPICRGAFIPEEDHDWAAADWSQIEYRMFVHFAHETYKKKPEMQTQAAVDAYNNDKSMDFHQKAADITGLSRSASKNINFGVVYGLGVPSLAETLGVTIEQATEILAQFNEHMPFGKDLLELCSKIAGKRGYIRTILGRKRRFEMYEASVRNRSGGITNFYGRADAFNDWLAKQKEDKNYGSMHQNLRRAKLHSALNALLQGSAADLMKKAMVDIHQAGLFDVLVAHLTVHDELDVSVPRTNEGKDAFNELVHIMETSIKLNIPVFADAKIGANWSECK